ncbi:MAG: hypothetical protein SFV15_07290 [Polyangiaceae bacterium]|nr:hypothetical protein [Polyangiaceae bacterium]
MIRFVFHLSRWAEWVGGLFVLAVAMRFTGVVFVDLVSRKLQTANTVQGPAVVREPSAGESAMAPVSTADLLKALQGHLPPGPSSEEAGRAAPGEPRKYATGDAVQVQLMVSLEPDRSDVLVNGTLVGKTPFIGDAGCRVGDKVKIDVIPEKGMPTTVQRPCVPGVIRVDRADMEPDGTR